MGTRRWRVELVEEAETLPVLRRPAGVDADEPRATARDPAHDSVAALVAALARVAFRDQGALAWGAPLADDPVAFLLDAIDEAVILREVRGNVLYVNPAASRGAGGRREAWRRSLPVRVGDMECLVEIIGHDGRGDGRSR